MGSTIKYWIVANLGLIIWIVVLFIGVLNVDFGEVKSLLHEQQTNDPESQSKRIEIMFWVTTLIFGCAFCLPTKKMDSSIARYILFCFLMFYSLYFGENTEANSVEIEAGKNLVSRIIWIGFVCSHLLALLLAVYTYRNFDEVVSRRMLYRNSAVDMFEEQMKYTICRLMDHALAFYFLYLVILMRLFYSFIQLGYVEN